MPDHSEKKEKRKKFPLIDDLIWCEVHSSSEYSSFFSFSEQIACNIAGKPNYYFMIFEKGICYNNREPESFELFAKLLKWFGSKNIYLRDNVCYLFNIKFAVRISVITIIKLKTTTEMVNTLRLIPDSLVIVKGAYSSNWLQINRH